MSLLAKVLAGVVIAGSLWGILGAVGSLATMAQSGHLQKLAESTEGLLYFGQVAVNAIISACAIALGGLVLAAREKKA